MYFQKRGINLAIYLIIWLDVAELRTYQTGFVRRRLLQVTLYF